MERTKEQGHYIGNSWPPTLNFNWIDPEKLKYMSGEGRMFETFKSVFIKVSILTAHHTDGRDAIH